MKPLVIASIEARMGASRLPGKVLADLAGKPALTRMLHRVRMAQTLDDIVVATTDQPPDDPITEWAACEGVDVFRGSEDDVLDRVLHAHEAMRSDVIVELCGDCPLIDPAIIDSAVRRFLVGDCDIVTTTEPQSYPQGLDVEVFALSTLRQIAFEDPDAQAREHVSIDFYRNPERWRLVGLRAPVTQHRPDVRLLLDHPTDLAFLTRLCADLDARCGEAFTTDDILALLDKAGGMTRTSAA